MPAKPATLDRPEPLAYRRLHPAAKRAGLDRLRDDPTVPLALRELMEILLWKFHNSTTGTLNPHPATIARKMGRSERQVRRLIAEACRRDLLEHQSTGRVYRWRRYHVAAHRYRPGPAFLALCKRPGWAPGPPGREAPPPDTDVPRTVESTPPGSAEIHQLDQRRSARRRAGVRDTGVRPGIHEPDSPAQRSGAPHRPRPARAEPGDRAAAPSRQAPAPAGANPPAFEGGDPRVLPSLPMEQLAALVAADRGWLLRPGAVIRHRGRLHVVPPHHPCVDTETDPRAQVWIEATAARLRRMPRREREGQLRHLRRYFTEAGDALLYRPDDLAAALYLFGRLTRGLSWDKLPPAAPAPAVPAGLYSRIRRSG